MGKRELVALLNLSSWCLVVVERLFLPVPWGCLRFVIVVFSDHTHILFLFRRRWCLGKLLVDSLTDERQIDNCHSMITIAHIEPMAWVM